MLTTAPLTGFPFSSVTVPLTSARVALAWFAPAGLSVVRLKTWRGVRATVARRHVRYSEQPLAVAVDYLIEARTAGHSDFCAGHRFSFLVSKSTHQGGFS